MALQLFVRGVCPTSSSYDLAVTQCPPVFETSVNRLTVNDYPACNLVSVEQHWGFDVSVYVYDATTYEMVGASYATDTNRFACDSSRVFELRGGVFPMANCAVVSRTLCANDAGSD